jgi:serine/threonine-protein kinase
MIRVPGATFGMGSSDPRSPPNERPRHVETVGSFWLDRTEVTVQAYRACVEAHACTLPAKSSASCTYDAGDPRLPVSCVHWRDAEAFCRAAGKRLPREAEWELAGRSPSGRRYPWLGAAMGCYYAATAVNEMGARTCTKRPSPVGAHPAGATPSGIFDLAGNVEEWTADWYVENLAHSGAPAAGASHVLRGGGWLSPPSAARMSSRNWGSSVEAGPNVGFRCAKDD